MRIELLFLCTLVSAWARICVPPSPLTLQMILDYVSSRSWSQVVIFTETNAMNCALNYARPIVECFGQLGVAVTIQPTNSPNVPLAFAIVTHRVGAIVLLDGSNVTSPENILQLASQKQLFNYYISWLLVTARSSDGTIDGLLANLNVGFDSDVVVATSGLDEGTSMKFLQKYPNNTCQKLENYAARYVQEDLPLVDQSREIGSSNLRHARNVNSSTAFYFVHVYKIRKTDNTSLVPSYIGSWNPGVLHDLRLPLGVKLRVDFRGFPIYFGVHNGSNDGSSDELEYNDIGPLENFATFVANNVNASVEMVYYDKLGQQNNKVWNHLLGDVVSGVVDIGLGYITVNDEKLEDMSFSHPLIQYMRNIYYQHLETGTMRNIFLQPFTNRLLVCVALTYFTILIAMGLIIYAARNIFNDDENKTVGFGEAALYCISIMCMQGSPWNPKSPSGKTLLLFSLIFALVTYNAYAGFITSILSVQAPGIKSIADILSNSFNLGCSTTDDEFITNTNDAELRQFYIKAFRNRETRLDTLSGLMKAVRGQYAFFVSATLARRTLRNTLVQDRCLIKELQLPQTLTTVALPMAKMCPYSILKIRETGVLKRIAENMLPDMQKCKSATTFHSARLADVYWAFIILLGGAVTSATIGIVERIWSNRKRMQESIVRGIRNHHIHLPHIHFPHYHHSHHDQHIADIQARVLRSRQEQMLRNDAVNSMIASTASQHHTHSEPRLGIWRKSFGTKRASWASFSGLARRRVKRSEPTSKIESNLQVFPFQH